MLFRSMLLLIVYVDDLVITGSNSSLIDKIKRSLLKEFDMKDLGQLHYCLGIEVWRNENSLFLTQAKYVKELLEKSEMMDSKPLPTPMEVNEKLTTNEHGKKVDGTIYRQLVGSLIYATITRPDLSFSITVLSQYMADPKESHLKAAKRVLRYLKGTFNYGIEYVSACDLTLHGYCD